MRPTAICCGTKHALPEGFGALHDANRGMALYRRQGLFRSGYDTVLVALNSQDQQGARGELKIKDWKQGYYTTMAPLVVEGKVLVGITGGEFGVRGLVRLSMHRPASRRRRPIPFQHPGEPGSDTWKKADTWKTSSTSTWMTGNYNPDTNTVYWGTGNASPWFRRSAARQRDLYTIINGAQQRHRRKIKGHFQYHQNQSLRDWDEMNAPMLVDFQANGVTTKGLLKPARNGYLYWLKRDTDGSIAYLRSQAFVPQNVFTSIDKETGRPEVDMAHKPAAGKSAQFCPRPLGRQGLAVQSLQSQDWACLHSIEQKPLQHARRQSRRARCRTVVDRRRHPGSALLRRHQGAVLWRDPGAGREFGQARLADLVSELDDVGIAAHHRRWTCLRRWHQRPAVPRL